MVSPFGRMAIRQFDPRLRRLELDKSKLHGAQTGLPVGLFAIVETRGKPQRQRIQIESDRFFGAKVNIINNNNFFGRNLVNES